MSSFIVWNHPSPLVPDCLKQHIRVSHWSPRSGCNYYLHLKLYYYCTSFRLIFCIENALLYFLSLVLWVTWWKYKITFINFFSKIFLALSVNNLFVDDIPAELDQLKKLEQIIIAQRIVFEKIIVMPKGQQRKIKGAICNVPYWNIVIVHIIILYNWHFHWLWHVLMKIFTQYFFFIRIFQLNMIVN